MIPSFNSICHKHDLKISGVIHVGSHHAEEVPSYIDAGINNIVLFEPLRDNFSYIKKATLPYQHLNIRKYRVALGNNHKTIIMNLASNALESSSILKPKLHLKTYPDIAFDSKEEVELHRLDEYNCEECNFLNMDVQGYELEVLKGAQKTLKHIDYVYCEVNCKENYENNALIEDIDYFLKEYSMSRIDTFWWLDDGWGDALYIKNAI